MTPEQIADECVPKWLKTHLTRECISLLCHRIADAIRAAAADEALREEAARTVREILKVVRDYAAYPPVTVNWKPEPGDVRQQIKEAAEKMLAATGGQALPMTPATARYASEIVGHLERLAFLLGLSSRERAFLREHEESGDPTTLAVFADWLEEQGRKADEVEGFRRLVPRTGDVFVFRVPRPLLPGDREEILHACQEIHDRQKELGREIFCVIIPDDYSMDQFDADQMRRLGWMKTSEHTEAYASLQHELNGQPEARYGYGGNALLKLIQRLKRENAELRTQAVS